MGYLDDSDLNLTNEQKTGIVGNTHSHSLTLSRRIVTIRMASSVTKSYD